MAKKLQILPWPPIAPAAQFWAFTLYNVATRGIILTEMPIALKLSSPLKGLEKQPRMVLSTSISALKARPDTSRNWIKDQQSEEWFAYFRLYAPTEKYFRSLLADQ